MNKPDRPTYGNFDLMLFGIGVLLALYAVGYCLSLYSQCFGHRPY